MSQMRHSHPFFPACPSGTPPRRASTLLRFRGRYFQPQTTNLAILADVSVPRRRMLGMALNLVGVAYYTGFWFQGEAFHSVYQIIQASRLIILWNVLHLLGPTTSGESVRHEMS